MHRAARQSTIVPGVEAVSILSDRTFPRHSHDEFGIGILVEGGQESWSGRGLVEARAGDVITVNPGELHDGIGRPGHARHWRMLFLSPAAIMNLLELPDRTFELERPVLRRSDARVAVATAVAAATSDHPDADRIVEALTLAVHGASGRVVAPEGDRLHRVSPPVARVIERIEADADLPLSLADHAATAGLGRYQVLRRFAREVGTTPHAYLMQHRVKLARRAIAAGSPLAEAALAAGFADQSHMTRAFARQLGVSPGSYRAS